MKSEIKIPTPPLLQSIKALIAGLISVIFMLYTVFESAIYACLVIALFLICVYKITPKGRGFAVSAGITAVAFFLLGASFETLAFVLSIISIAVIGALMLSSSKSGIIFAAFTTGAYIVSALLSSPADALSSLVGIPSAIALAICAKLKLPRISAVCTLSAVFIVTLVSPLLLWIYLTYGSDSAEQVKLFFDSIRTTQAEAISTAISSVFADSNPDLAAKFDKQTVTDLIDTAISLLPAVIIIISNIIAISIHTLSLRARQALGGDVSEEEKKFSLSKVSAWLYIISFISLFIGGAESNSARATLLTLQNINLILTPSFFLVGIKSISLVIGPAGAKNNIFNTVMLILTIMYCGTLLIYPIVALGVIRTINSGKTPNKPQNS